MRMSRLESAIRIILKFNEAFNRHDVAGMMQLVSDDCIFESTGPAPDGTVYSGKEAVTRFWQDFFRESPHAHIKIEQTFGFGIRCVMRWRYDWMDVAGTCPRSRYIPSEERFHLRTAILCEGIGWMRIMEMTLNGGRSECLPVVGRIGVEPGGCICLVCRQVRRINSRAAFLKQRLVPRQPTPAARSPHPRPAFSAPPRPPPPLPLSRGTASPGRRCGR
jgi:hypothetical protein